MAETSSIEWTDATWNPITGCSVVSPGCTNCYAMKLAGTRLRSLPSRKGLTVETKAGPVWNGRVRMNEEWLTQPLRWRRPRKIFVCAHGDLFAENVPDEWIDRVFAVMALAPQHTFQVLTKRAARMRAYLSSRSVRDEHGYEAEDIRVRMTALAGTPSRREMCPALKAIPLGQYCRQVAWPLPNVWLGVSAEDQRRADERVPDLLATPAAVRFVSAEPLLGPIDFGLGRGWCRACGEITSGLIDGYSMDPASPCFAGETTLDAMLHWIIVGGESGPGARPMHPEWARQIRDACADAGVAFHYKQAGAWAALAPDGGLWPDDAAPFIRLRVDGSRGPDGWPMQRVGKKVAGRNLDGVTHDAFPEVRHE